MIRKTMYAFSSHLRLNANVFGLWLLLIVSVFFNQTSNATEKTDSKYKDFPEKQLQNGKKIWLENCESCHAYGIGDAPIPMEPAAWDFRIKKGKTILYEHAINGFFGPDDAMMPARGGNSELSDDEVKAAVDYMVALATHFIEQTK